MSKKEEIYFSIDIEADGPIPGIFSMLSLGCVAFDKEGNELGDFSVNFDTLSQAGTDHDTDKFWARFPEAYAETRINTVYAGEAMYKFNEFVESIEGFPVFVGYPAGFDFTFVYWYFIRFTGKCPFSFSSLDMKSYAMAKMGTNFRETTKKNFPKHWKEKGRHTHVAVEDAREQGRMFIKMLRDGTELPTHTLDALLKAPSFNGENQ